MDGFINLYKDSGWTSHDCVAKLRRLLQTKKVGHGGTLDPSARGVLPIAVGRATRLLQYLPTDKAYRAVVRFGLTTNTDDLAGEVLSQTPADHLDRAAVEAQLPSFQGTIEQVPPLYSAIHVDGQRLYRLARKGSIDIEIPSRSVTIYSIQATDWTPGHQPELTLDITCGPGTYIRSIARDLGQHLGVGATLRSLLRTKSCGFTLERSVSLTDIATESNQSCAIAPATAMAHLPKVVLSEEAARRWRCGQKLINPADFPESQVVRVASNACDFLGIGQPMNDRGVTYLVPKMVFQPPSFI